MLSPSSPSSFLHGTHATGSATLFYLYCLSASSNALLSQQDVCCYGLPYSWPLLCTSQSPRVIIRYMLSYYLPCVRAVYYFQIPCSDWDPSVLPWKAHFEKQLTACFVLRFSALHYSRWLFCVQYQPRVIVICGDEINSQLSGLGWIILKFLLVWVFFLS
jgi:hypothetical protein